MGHRPFVTVRSLRQDTALGAGNRFDLVSSKLAINLHVGRPWFIPGRCVICGVRDEDAIDLYIV